MGVTPVLKRFEILVLKDKGGGDKSQIPTAAQVDFYRQGATLSALALLESGTPTEVDVYDRGSLAAGDTVQRDTSASPTLTVGTHPSNAKKLLVTYSGPGELEIDAEVRLVPTNNRPKVYLDPSGASATSNSYITTSSVDGRGGCYIAAYRFDYIVSFSSTKRLYVDADGSFVMRT